MEFIKDFDDDDNSEELQDYIRRHLLALEDWGVGEEIQIPDWSPSYSPGPLPPTPELLPRMVSTPLLHAVPSPHLPTLSISPIPSSPPPPVPMSYESWLLCDDVETVLYAPLAHPDVRIPMPSTMTYEEWLKYEDEEWLLMEEKCSEDEEWTAAEDEEWATAEESMIHDVALIQASEALSSCIA